MKKSILLLVLFVCTTSIYAKSEAQSIYVEVTGKGQPILLLPGFTVPGEVWKPLVKVLEKKYECHIVTLAGFGGKALTAFPMFCWINSSK